MKFETSTEPQKKPTPRTNHLDPREYESRLQCMSPRLSFLLASDVDNFQFANLLGTVYCRGNLVFTPDGNSLLSPVGNRVSCFDLVKCANHSLDLCALQRYDTDFWVRSNKSFTFNFEHRKNIARIALSPQGTLLLSVDEGLTYSPCNT